MPQHSPETDSYAHTEHSNRNTPRNQKNLKYVALAPGGDFDTHIALVQNYLLEGPASPEELVDAFIHTSFFVLDKHMPFGAYLSALTDGIAKGYNQERLYLHIEKIQ